MKLDAHRIIVIVVALIVIAVLCIAYNVNQTIRDSYAVWWVSDMVIEHLRLNDDTWPTGWNDLRDDYETCVERSGQPWTFEELRNRVTIEFDANVSELKDRSRGREQPDFSVIWLSDGSDSHWTGHEPNTKLLQYFNETTPPAPLRTGFGGSSAE